MRLPPLLQDSQFFLFSSVEELIAALGNSVSVADKHEVKRLAELGLPPLATRDVLATMLGINPGLVWSFEYRPGKHYRTFTIPKGSGRYREIVAPRVALKVVQKWLSVCLQKAYKAPPHVFGFVPGKSHLDAAKVHAGAKWTFSVDISNFFPTTPISIVEGVFTRLGFNIDSARIIARLCCYRGFLAQGAPSSPVLSNFALDLVDSRLVEIAEKYGVRLSRYADDIVYSGLNDFPLELRAEVEGVMADTPWAISPEKTELHQLPRRLKVHGLLVQGVKIRLTKGYRNKIRAYAHLANNGGLQEDTRKKVMGHLMYANQVENNA